MSHFHAYVYGNEVLVFTDHSAVKAILETPSPNGKHARWWTKVYGSGVKQLEIRYCPGKENANADALSRNLEPATTTENFELDTQVLAISSHATEQTVQELLNLQPSSISSYNCNFGASQREDPEVKEIIDFLLDNKLPEEEKRKQKVATQAPLFTMVDDILYYVNPKQNNEKRVVVPKHLRDEIMKENHSGRMAGHFSGSRLYNTLVHHWWWEGMYKDALDHSKRCPQCAIVSGGGHVHKPPLHPIPVERAFQILGVDIMELPKTSKGNQYVVVFQDFLTKWPMVFPIPDQKSLRIVQLLVENIIPIFGVPEALLSDHGTNLLSHLMQDVCKLLGIKKLNTTAYHPQCDGMVVRFNRTLKMMLRKHASVHGNQWDRYLSGVLFAYRNTPHESTKEKPSFLLFGFDCRSPTEAAYLPPDSLQDINITDYRQELMVSLTSARELAIQNIREAQGRYKKQYDKKANPAEYKVGQWVLIRFPHEESGHIRKLSRPWHGPYRIQSVNDPDVTATKVYFPQKPPTHITLY